MVRTDPRPTIAERLPRAVVRELEPDEPMADAVRESDGRAPSRPGCSASTAATDPSRGWRTSRSSSTCRCCAARRHVQPLRTGGGHRDRRPGDRCAAGGRRGRGQRRRTDRRRSEHRPFSTSPRSGSTPISSPSARGAGRAWANGSAGSSPPGASCATPSRSTSSSRAGVRGCGRCSRASGATPPARSPRCSGARSPTTSSTSASSTRAVPGLRPSPRCPSARRRERCCARCDCCRPASDIEQITATEIAISVRPRAGEATFYAHDGELDRRPAVGDDGRYTLRCRIVPQALRVYAPRA